MISETIVELSRWQFAITAMLHFLFIPLTLGLALFLALMETAYVWKGDVVYKTMAQFWGRVFAINFVLALITRMLVIFQFGMNGSYFSHFVGDIFALPLAIEVISSFLLVAVLFGPYWFGWDKFTPKQHLFLTWLIAIAVNASAFWILLDNGWMQNPVGAIFNYESYRMELSDFNHVLSNPAVIAKYVHTVAASYAMSSATLIAISAYFLKRNPSDRMALLTCRLSAGLGLVAILVTVGFGDATPNLNHMVQHAKKAAISGETDRNLLPEVEARVRNGIKAYEQLERLRDGDRTPSLLKDFERYRADLGYALFLTPIHKQIVGASDKQISLAAQSVLPAYPGLIRWAYRLMIACGMASVLVFVLAVWGGFQAKLLQSLINLFIYSAPLPWIASVFGWIVAEVGKQPWAISGILPTFLSVSSESVTQLIVSTAAFALAYALLAAAGLFLMRQAISGRSAAMKGG
ncbi:cytochrome ubiquinol oxidase subunit I [Methylomonas sp. MgM2]